MKKGQVTIFILVALVLVGGIVLVAWLKANDHSSVEVVECSEDSDCVPNECCDAQFCVAETGALDCFGVECAPGCKNYEDDSLGCATLGGGGKGSCSCVGGKCAPVWP
jgi:hypothetical protein